ncbi:type IV secretion protein Rhs [Pedobacter sp. PAMC26386]|nr:type IV secretion protein Rhs [Pedobacter sp. PAMC26386]
MVNKLIVDISIEQVTITHFSRFTLDQRFNEHHTFELRINHDQVEETGGITLAKSKDFIGKNLTIQFARLGEAGTLFTGIITKVEVAQTHGFRGDVVISGYSPDILLNRGPDLGSYLNKDLKSILQQATNDTPQNDLDFQINPSYSATIDYIIQYKESDFDFINRLSAEYHEWFYYDGRILHFGKPDKQEEVALIYGRDLHSLQYGMQIAPLNYKKFAYHSQQDELLSAQPSGASSSFSDLSHAISASNDVFSKKFNQPLSVRVNSQREIDTFVNDEHKALVSGLVNISGQGDNARVGIGKIVDISTSMHNGLDFQVEDFGKFIVTAIHHEIDGVGHYHHNFEGVAADNEKIQVKHTQKPLADMQLADVVDNNDPQGQGRIKVKFKWQCQCNDPTEWLRVMTPDAGSSEKVSKNRGFVFIPEKGDQVVVAFEEGNIARPIVLGSVFHGNSGTGGSASNNSKSLTSKSGHTVQLNDGGGITIKDKTGGNHIVVDGQNKVTVTSSQTVVLTNGTAAITLEKDKITIHASEIEIAKQGGKSTKIDINGDTTNINTKDMTITSTNNTISGKNHITGGDTKIDMGDVFIN